MKEEESKVGYHHRKKGYVQEGRLYGLTTLNKPKSRQVYTNDGIITQNIFNAAVSTSVELKTNTKKLYFCEYLLST